ncbi:conjugative transfer relaxase/helicase TraI domain-containing protein [Kosakonia cowanii]|uniref:conjugative transfer relaxase/helicase TraI domain-containing protein n=1 Tax=Kosakonia cowanii TaxID=208223 RepID=UPI003981FED6
MLTRSHDALSPQTERKQAKVIWAMGQPVGKTAIGRAWSRHEAMGEHNLTARVIPATRRFPEPSLALPLYDNNGRSAGLALVSLVASDTGRLMRGDVRMVATQGATGAVMQRSRSGNTHVVRTADEAFKAVREHPGDGVVWQTGDGKPSTWMLKVSQGAALSEEAARAQTIRLAESEAVTLPAIAPVRDDEPVPARAIEQAIQELRGRDEYAIAEAQRQQEMQAYEEYQSRTVLPEEESVADIRLSMKDDATQERQPAPDGKDIARIAGEEREHQADKARTGPLPALSQDKATGERAVAGQVAQELAERQRDMPLPRDMPERGREIEHQEHAPPRTIQKER